MKVWFNVLVHEGRKLFCVSTHAVTTPMKYIGAKYSTRKAREMYEREGATRSITGVMIAMVNTDYEGWVDHKEGLLYEKEDYLAVKQAHINFWEEKGYTNVGLNMAVSHGPGDGSKGSEWNKKFNPTTMTKAKIMKKIEFINLSLQLEIPQYVYNQAYLEIVSNRPRTVDYHVDSMMSLLRFVRECMISDQVSEAA